MSVTPHDMPTGDSPIKAQQYYHYLNGHQETMYRPDTWHVRWLDLAWLWGFVIALALVLLLWVWQYRTTRQRTGIYPVDSFGGYTTEMAGPATFFFLLLTLILAAWAVVLIVGHLVWGQKF
jgi:polyferredoxin